MDSTERMAKLSDVVDRVVGDDYTQKSVAHGEMTILVPSLRIAEVACKLRDDPASDMAQLMNVTCADYPEREERFEVIYQFLSLRHNWRLTVKALVRDGASVPSLVPVYHSAGWFEREVFDLFGVTFANHPDLRRILTDYGFEGHPLRKDFPLSGHVQVRYDVTQKRVVYEPVSLKQEYRNFDKLSPWTAMPVTKEGA